MKVVQGGSSGGSRLMGYGIRLTSDWFSSNRYWNHGGSGGGDRWYLQMIGGESTQNDNP